MRELLCTVVGGGVLDAPFVSLSKYGDIAKKHISAIGAHYRGIAFDKYVIMPNHIQMIVIVYEENDFGTSRTPSPTNAVIPAIISTLKRFIHKEIGFTLFQRSCFDHI